MVQWKQKKKDINNNLTVNCKKNEKKDKEIKKKC